MNQFMLVAICRIIIGPTGHRCRMYPDIRTAYIEGLFADYFRCNPHISEETCRKYYRRAKPYPRPLIRHYSGPTGYRRTLGDMMGICDACPSIILLRTIQEDIHRWVGEHLPETDIRDLDVHHIPHNSSRRQIAKYFAVTMHYSICHEVDNC